MSLDTAILPTAPEALRAFALACQAELAVANGKLGATTAELNTTAAELRAAKVEPQRRLVAHLRSDVLRPGLRLPDRRLDHHSRPPACVGGKKRGSEEQAIGRSRGGLSTKIHMAVRGLGCPVRFTLTAGQKGDAPQAGPLIEGLPAGVVMADTASSPRFRPPSDGRILPPRQIMAHGTALRDVHQPVSDACEVVACRGAGAGG